MVMSRVGARPLDLEVDRVAVVGESGKGGWGMHILLRIPVVLLKVHRDMTVLSRTDHHVAVAPPETEAIRHPDGTF